MSVFERIKEFVLNAAICIFIITVIFISSEIILRWQLRVFPFKYRCKEDRGFVLDAELGYRVKGIEGYNSLGLKNPEILPKANQFRILLLGDSVALRLKNDLLKEQLKIRHPYIDIEIINAGVPGYTTRQELDFLKKYVIDIKPDLVILSFVLNDLFIYLHRPNAEGRLGKWHPYAQRTWFADGCFLGKIFHRSYFAHYIAERINFVCWDLKGKLGRSIYGFEVKFDFHAAWKDFMWRSEERLLIAMQNLLQSNNIPMAIVCFPVKEQVAEENIKKDKLFVLKPQRKLLVICQKLKIPLLDLWRTFYERRDEENFYDYLHFTRAGNTIVVNRLAEFINEQGFIKK